MLEVGSRESQANLMVARYYEANLGRFLEADPKRGSSRPEQPQSWNRYTYVLNNPLLLTDPDGMDALEDAKNAASKILSVSGGPALGLQAKLQVGPVKIEAGGSMGSSGKLDLITGKTEVKTEASIGVKVQVGPVKIGLEGSVEKTTVEDGKAVEHPQSKPEIVPGLSIEHGSAEGIGDLKVEATLGVAKVGATFNPIALGEAVVKGAIAVRQGLHDLVTTPEPTAKKP